MTVRRNGRGGTWTRCHSYITLLTDLEPSRVLEVVEDRTREAAGQLWDTLSPKQKAAVEAVAVDLWEPFIQSVREQVPDADVVHDKFQVSKIQSIKSAARGFRNFKNHRPRILFFCGKLDLYPL